jgi:hypothetical protein
MPKIILSYRRSDTDAIAGRIRDNLAVYYGNESVFIDVDNIPFGTDFRDHIRKTFGDHDLMIAIIGQKWLGARKGGRTRIQDETDPVRVEVEMALQRGMPIIPVLVNGAHMPKPEELPQPLKDFSFRNAAEVESGRDFRQHMDRLIRSIDKILQLKPRTAAASGTGWSWSTKMVALACAAIVVAAVGIFAFENSTKFSGQGPAGTVQSAAKAAAPAIATGEVVVEFSRANVDKQPVAARPYLHEFGIAVEDLVPAGSEIVLVNNRGLYEGGGVRPTTSQIFLTQTGTNNVVASYSLVFDPPVDSLSFTRPALYADTKSGVTHPAWNAVAYAAGGQQLSSQSEGLIRSFGTVAALTYTLIAPGFDRIAKVTFTSDPRLNGKPFAGFSTLLIERLTLTRLPKRP